jgi:hypothetical protein
LPIFNKKKSWISLSNRLIHTQSAYTYICIRTYVFSLNDIHTCTRLKYRSQKSLQHPTPSEKMEDEERAYHNAHYQEKLESLKANGLASPAYSSKHLERMPLVKVLPTNPSLLFRSRQQLSPKKEWVNMVRSPNTIQHLCRQQH